MKALVNDNASTRADFSIHLAEMVEPTLREGSVGSLVTQIRKTRPGAFVSATRSRAESKARCHEMGADLVLDYSYYIVKLPASACSLTSTSHSRSQGGRKEGVDRPFGHPCVGDSGPPLDLGRFVMKAVSPNARFVLNGGSPENGAPSAKTSQA